MQLINTTTMEMREFSHKNAPRYAILSHCWYDGEISFVQYQQLDKESFKGYCKVAKFCSISRQSFGLDWAWVDTCCIDKRSSAELSEAINAMFRFYREAAICIVYLEDFLTPPMRDDHFHNVQLVSSRWFTRGWTLQELIASRVAYFYCRSWQPIGMKGGSIHYFNLMQEVFTDIGNRNRSYDLVPEQRDLNVFLSTITGIPKALLAGQHECRHYTIAQRLSWMAHRTTARDEDMSYCLLGLLDINMPLLYGEGAERAWIRLQEALLNTSSDETIFAWGYCRDIPDNPLREVVPVLAWDQTQFASSSITNDPIQRLDIASRHGYSISNHGLTINVLAGTAMVVKYFGGQGLALPLNCTTNPSTSTHRQLPLVLLLYEHSCGHYSRTSVVQLYGRMSYNWLIKDIVKCKPLAQDMVIHMHTSKAAIEQCRSRHHRKDCPRQIDLPTALKSCNDNRSAHLDDICTPM